MSAPTNGEIGIVAPGACMTPLTLVNKGDLGTLTITQEDMMDAKGVWRHLKVTMAGRPFFLLSFRDIDAISKYFRAHKQQVSGIQPAPLRSILKEKNLKAEALRAELGEARREIARLKDENEALKKALPPAPPKTEKPKRAVRVDPAKKYRVEIIIPGVGKRVLLNTDERYRLAVLASLEEGGATLVRVGNASYSVREVAA